MKLLTKLLSGKSRLYGNSSTKRNCRMLILEDYNENVLLTIECYGKTSYVFVA